MITLGPPHNWQDMQLHDTLLWEVKLRIAIHCTCTGVGFLPTHNQTDISTIIVEETLCQLYAHLCYRSQRWYRQTRTRGWDRGGTARSHVLGTSREAYSDPYPGLVYLVTSPRSPPCGGEELSEVTLNLVLKNVAHLRAGSRGPICYKYVTNYKMQI